VDYPVKTLGQLRPILQGFRKAAGFTQAMMASHLGVTQQTYAQLETNPAAVSVERLFRVLRVLDVDLTLAQSAAQPQQGERAARTAPPSAAPSPARLSAASRKATAGAAKTSSVEATGQGKRTSPTQPPRKKQTAPATPARAKEPAKRARAKTAPTTAPTTARKIASKTAGKTASATQRNAAKASRGSKHRENW
jgi:HTH-type transcriptional regulator/antitoxin HipB